MKDPIIFRNSETNERKAVFGLKDFIDVYVDNMNTMENGIEMSFRATDARITKLERSLKRAKINNFMCFVALAAGIAWNSRKIIDLELEVDRLDNKRHDTEYFDED